MSAIIYNKMSEKHACLIGNKNWRKTMPAYQKNK